MTFRCYTNGHEWGIDFPSLAAARAAIAAFKAAWPRRRFTIRRAKP